MLIAILGLVALPGCESVGKVRDRFGVSLTGEAPPRAAAVEGTSLIHQIQTQLALAGYSPGRADGKLTLQTEAAIQDFQLDHDLRIDGRASEPLLEAIEAVVTEQAARRADPPA